MSQTVFTLMPILLFTPRPSLLLPGRGNSGGRNATRTRLSVWQPFSNWVWEDPQAAAHRPVQSLSSARPVRRKDSRRWAGGRTPNDGRKASTSVLFTREILVSAERRWAPDVLFTRSRTSLGGRCLYSFYVVRDWFSRRLHVCTMAAVWFVVASFGEQLGTDHTLDSGVRR